MRVHLKTLGCRLNEAELESWARDFRKHGFSITNDASEADLVVVNSCAVTEEAVRKSRKLMRRTHRDNPSARLVMSGCYASLNPEQAAADLGVDLLVSNRDKDRLVQLVTQELHLPAMPTLAMEPAAQSLLRRNRQRAFIKVQDGCRYRCTYCIVTLARGDEHSRPVSDVIKEINRLEQTGIKEVVLAGVHLGGYGSDINSSLRQLVSSVLADTDMPRIRLGSLEPWDLPEDFWDLFQNARLMPHLHLPIQSGADSVLQRMSRRCRTSEFQALIKGARASVADFNVTTDIIVGFPGETDDEWQQTLSFVEEIGFGHIHIFAYSQRQGTKAAMLPNQLPRSVKQQRSEALHQLAGQLKRKTLEQFRGRTFEILVEGEPSIAGGAQQLSGYTPNYLRVNFTGNAALKNQILSVQTDALADDEDQLSGHLT
jgi:threonylcarbamoyladenosine tRNA methylthiotransferase MtaB